jgi:chromosome partitioning protein
LAELRKRPLLIDLSAQADTTYWCRIKNKECGVLKLFSSDGDPTNLTQPAVMNGVDIIPSSEWLIEAEKALVRRTGAETLLRNHISLLPQERWDYIILDCPSSLGKLTVNALTAAHSAIIPAEAHVMCLNGFPHLLKLIEKVRKSFNSDLRVSGILACRVNTRIRHDQEVVELLRKHFGKLIYETIIRENIRLAESPSFGQPITQYDARSSGAEDYRNFTQEFLAREGQEK